ncbi:MAG: hypothetical protein JSR87_12640 [Proteobacteria bacterium]|nr:hypothetical protein [Pseudomonadota bacterium]MBS0573868.1 hypothetical protein [Pseudomonadota bacterium]
MTDHTDLLPPVPAVDEAAGTARRVLILGPADLEAAHGDGAQAARIADLGGLTAAAMAAIRPDMVVAPLLDPGFDILDVLGRLDHFGFRGRLCAVSPPLPDPAAVTSEVRGQCRGIDFSLITRPGALPGQPLAVSG